MADIHFTCKHRLNWERLDAGVFRTGTWKVADTTADEIVNTDGRVYLHEHQDENAWHGGKVISWERDPVRPERKWFSYVVDQPFRFRCPGVWSQEKSIVR